MGTNDIIKDAVNLSVAELTHIYITSGSQVELNNTDLLSKNSIVELGNGGTLTLRNVITSSETGYETGSIQAKAGTLNVLKASDTEVDTILGNPNDLIEKAVIATIAEDAILEIKGATVTLNKDVTDPASADTWNGRVSLTSGTLNVLGDMTRGEKALFTASDGNLNIGNGSVTTVLELNRSQDVIEDGAIVNIAENATLKVNYADSTDHSNDATATLNTGDTWTGNVELDAGKLIIDALSKTTTATSTYVQKGGNMLLDNGAELVLNTKESYINNTSLVGLANASKLTLNNGSTVNNVAEAITTDTTANELTLSGNSKLQLVGSSQINKETKVAINSGSELAISSTSVNGVVLNGDTTTPASKDTWVGTVSQTGGKLHVTGYDDSTNTNGKIVVTGGELDIDGGVLTVGTGSTITTGDTNAKVVIASGTTLDITGGNVTLDGGVQDTTKHQQVDWQGTVHLNGENAHLTLNNIYDESRTERGSHVANKTTTGVLNAENGYLTINADNVLLGSQDIIKDAVHLTLQTTDLYVGTGTANEPASVYIGQKDDSWKGTVHVKNDGTLTLDGVSTVASGAGANNINAVGGTLILKDSGASSYGSGNGVTFNNSSDLVEYAVATTVESDVTINAGHIQLDDADTLTSGKITLGTASSSNGTLDLKGVTTGTTQLDAKFGTLNIQGTDKVTTLNNTTGDTIAKAVVTTIDSGATLKINSANANVTLNQDVTDPVSADTWTGNVELNNGNLILDTVTKTTTAASTYVQDGGTLTMTGSTLVLAQKDSKITNSTTSTSTVNVNGGSSLTFDNNNGTTVTENSAVIKSDENASNALTVGGTNDGAKLTLVSGSDIKSGTSVTIKTNGELTATGTSIKGDGTKGIINDGVFNLTNDGTVAGVLARAVNNEAETGMTGTVNLTGKTMSNEAGTINQATVNVGDGSGDAGSDKSVFTMGADVTVNTELNVRKDGKIINGSDNIVAQTIDVAVGGSIIGDTSVSPAEYGNLTVKNGGTNAGTIVQGNVELKEPAGTETFNNIGKLTATGTFTNNIEVTDTMASGTLEIEGGGESNASITQKDIMVAGSTAFANKADMTATHLLDNIGIINNTSNITVQNTTSKDALLNNSGDINSTNGNVNADTVTNTGTIGLDTSNLVISYQSGDIGGTLKVIGTDKSKTSTVSATQKGAEQLPANFTGTVDVQSGTMELNKGSIVENAITRIAAGSEMHIKGADASVVLNGTGEKADTWAGDLNLEEGSATLKDMVVAASAKETTPESAKPYFEQTGGSLFLENATLALENAGVINAPSTGTPDTGGIVSIDSNSHLVAQKGVFEVETLISSGTVHSINGGYENHLFDNHVVGNLDGGTQANYTVDLYARSNTNKKYDQFGKDSTVISTLDPALKGTVYVSDIAVNGDLFGKDAPIDRKITINNLFRGSVAPGYNVQFKSTDKEIETALGWYKLKSNGGGNYSFDLVRFNEGAFRGQITKLAQCQNQLAIDDMLFNHTMLDQGFKENDYITANPNQYASASDLFAPYQYSRKEGGLWVKTYGNFERLHTGGMDVGNNAYGTIVGADFGLKDLKRGWQFMPTAYVGYNGAHQYWKGFGAYQNGAQLGFMGTFYKNNFMVGTLAYGGFYGNEMSTPRGNDQTFNYFAGGAVKTAYNWKLHKNWALQPNLLVAYNFFGQENWHTDFGQMGMMAGMLHGINVAPGLNLIYERETWSTYLTVQYMYNVNQAVGGRAGNINMPHMSMDRGYLQYGLGINKKFTDRFSGYFQTVIRNVGRNGVGLQLGFQWKLGKGSSNHNTKGNVTPQLPKAKITVNGVEQK